MLFTKKKNGITYSMEVDMEDLEIQNTSINDKTVTQEYFEDQVWLEFQCLNALEFSNVADLK